MAGWSLLPAPWGRSSWSSRQAAARSVIDAVHEPAPVIPIAAVDAAVGELEVVVLAREGALAPPFPGHPPRACRANHPPAKSFAAHEVGTAAVREHLDGTRRPERAHNEPAAVGGRRRGRAAEREGCQRDRARSVG